MRLSPKLEISLQHAIQEAHIQRHEIFSIEQFVLCLLNMSKIKNILINIGVDIDDFQNNLIAYVEENAQLKKDIKQNIPPILSTGVQRMLQNSWHQVMSSGKTHVEPEDILVSLFNEEDCFAKFELESKYNVSRINLINEISHGESKSPNGEMETEEDFMSSPRSALKDFTVDLIERAAENKLHPFVARDDLLKRIVHICSRKTKNNPLIIGDPGVGKSALALGFAMKIQENEVPKDLKGYNVYSLDSTRLFAGAKFRGEMEERLHALLKELTEKGKSFLIIDDIHAMLNTSGGQNASLDISHILKPILSDDNIKVIATTNSKDFHQSMEKNSSLLRYFQKFPIEEPSVEQSTEILSSFKKEYEEYHQVKIGNECLKKAVQLSKRYLFERKLPDKALDLLDETCAKIKLAHKREDNTMTIDDLHDVVASMSGIPSQNLNKSEGEKLKLLPQKLHEKIFGQDEAIQKLCQAVKFSYAGLNRDNKPIGSYLFAGPTGVGKTELAIQLAEVLGNKFQKFDMSEYLEKHAVSRLVGAPPGYVGYEEGGLLTEAISKNPYMVLLMDEIEKAHPDLINILLQIMDSGQLTDSNGKTVDCRNLILIMTSNAGSKDQSQTAIGFSNTHNIEFDMNQLKRFFSPEFLNRIDAVVPFHPLSKQTLSKIVEKFLAEIKEQMRSKNVEMDFDNEVVQCLLEKSYDPLYGARPIYRKLNDFIKAPLVDEILFGKLNPSGKVKIVCKNNELEFVYNK